MTRHEEQTAGLTLLRTCRDSLKAYFAELKLAFIQRRNQVIAAELEKVEARRQRREEQRAQESEAVQQLKQAIVLEGGDRLEKLDAEMRAEENERGRRQDRAKRYGVHMKRLGLSPAVDETSFNEQRGSLATMREQAADQENRLENSLREAIFDFDRRREEHTALAGEIASLKLRPSNIPAQQVQIRTRLCAELGLESESLPFAGELLQVRAEESRWEGALERVMYGFATSLLVTEANYARVAAWVDRTNLDRRRLVYLRTRSSGAKISQQPLQQASLVQKLAVKQDSAFSAWVQAELRDRFDYACCATQEQFQSAYRALSLAGQVKDNAIRHVKDDRTRLDDRSNYVLGWSNEAKLAVLEQKREALEAQLAEIGGVLARTESLKQIERQKLEAITALQEFISFREIDWPACESLLQRLNEEKRRLEQASDTLGTLRLQLQESHQRLRASEIALSEVAEQKGKENQKLENLERLRLESLTLAVPIDAGVRARLDELRSAHGNSEKITLESCDQHERGLRDELQGSMDAETKRQESLRERIVRAMSAFRHEYPLESVDFDASLAAQAEYRTLLEQLRFHDLPRFEEQFKKELNTNSIRRIAICQSNLAREADEIRERIQRINESLHEIDYNHHYNRARFIELIQQPTFRPEIRQFRDDLRACIDSSLSGSEDDHYTEAKFEQVKKILDRLRGRQGFIDADRRWRDTVTDVRQWFQFSASEKWRDDESEYEHHTDSGGKSGGQKEKLAYTVLAASLAYQFKLDWFEDRSKSFRFVLIDEAFGRSSDESAEYGLELFRKLNLQLLIVTPLQKTHVIEPYVSSVGFVENRSGMASTVLNLSIAEHRRQKAERSQ